MRTRSQRAAAGVVNKAAAGVVNKAAAGVLGMAAAGMLAATLLAEAPVAAPALMPLPRHMDAGSGRYILKPETHLGYAHFHNARLEDAAVRMMARLQFESGVRLPHFPETAAGEAATAGIVLDVAGPGEAVQSPAEDESYRLNVTADRITIAAPTVVGAMHGMETLLQLVQLTDNQAVVPAVSIEDSPRFPWRGLEIDVSRHFEPVPVLERMLDGMAMVKLNVFHWHLSDDQGFRAESRLYPKLTGMGSHGQYYTQEQMRQVVAYARARGIRVVPEFDIPGHTISWMVGYPALSSSPGPFRLADVAGIHDEALDPTREATYVFLSRFIGEMARIFPDPYFHIGGDEVNGKVWTDNPRIARFMKARGYKTPAELQTYFSQRVARLVIQHGKKPVGWDEILTPGLPRTVLVQSWRGVDSLAAGARQGYTGILSAPYYLDAMRTSEALFLADPVPADTTLSAEQQRLILGGEACMWSEQINPRTIDSRIWPRTAVIAERFWSPQADRDVDSMYRRLPQVSIELEQAGLMHLMGPAMMRRSLSGQLDPEALTVLAGVIEPVSFGERSEIQQTDAGTPLDRLVDAVVPDPPSRFEIARDVAAATGRGADAEAAQARLLQRFRRWQQVAPGLEAAMRQNPRMSDAAPRAAQLGELAAIGTAAVLRINPELADKHAKPKPADRSAALATIEEAARPVALVRFTFLDSLRTLVEAQP